MLAKCNKPKLWYEQKYVCINATLNGAYAFELTGFTGTAAPFTPFASVRNTNFNGAGTFSGRGYRVVASSELENRVSGTYRVQNNCSVTFNYSVFRLDGTKTDDAVLFGVITDNGDKVRIVLRTASGVPGTYSGVFEKVR